MGTIYPDTTFHLNADPDHFFTSIRIRIRIWILYLIKVMRISDNWSTDLLVLHFENVPGPHGFSIYC